MAVGKTRKGVSRVLTNTGDTFPSPAESDNVELISATLQRASDPHRHAVRGQRRAYLRNHPEERPIPHFIGVDGEGVPDGRGHHNYVLLGVGDNQIENPNGLSFEAIMAFLYSQFEDNPGSVFVGFYLEYDFTQWLKGLPEGRVRSLLTEEGISKRKRRSGINPRPFPVRYNGWEFDILTKRRFKLRPQCCDRVAEKGHRNTKEHPAYQYMNICDAGPFFQTSLLAAIDPEKWPEPIVTEEEYRLLKANKEARGQVKLDNAMRKYNALENDVLCRLMERQATGLTKMGIRLKKDQWFGPGQATQVWLGNTEIKRRKDNNVPNDEFREAARKSFFGGWFEIFMHGVIPGKSYNYDINSAYPHIMRTLPCLLHGRYTHKKRGNYPKDGQIVICEAKVEGSDPYCGAMLHRSQAGLISRPSQSRGYYWLSELEAAVRAGLIDSFHVYEWWAYDPCNCRPPLRNLEGLYDHRQRVGKNTPEGIACKLVYNSAYGKMAQAVGDAPYGNWVYASLITSGCRTMILDAIATHPEGTRALEMVATDGVFFRSPHPTLPLSKTELGMWDESVKEDLCLFKPGVYWDGKSKVNASFKSRGFRASDFTRQIPGIEESFDRLKEFATKWPLHPMAMDKWPYAECISHFSMVSAKLALARGKWETVGAIHTDMSFTQSSFPFPKRMPFPYVEDGVLRTRPFTVEKKNGLISAPYDKHYRDEREAAWANEDYVTPDGEDMADVIEELHGR